MKRIAVVACIVALSLSSVSLAQDSASKARAYRQTHESQIIAELSELLSIPNVASDTPNIRRNAAKVIEMMSSRGIQSRLLEGDGPPAIFGELKTPGASRTIGLYAHYDGQPVDPTKWSTGPFKPVLRDKPLEAGGREIPLPKAAEKIDPEWRLYARSASDDKAPIIAMLAALDALKASNLKLTSNLKFLFDGEE